MGRPIMTNNRLEEVGDLPFLWLVIHSSLDGCLVHNKAILCFSSILVGSWLLCMQYFPHSVTFWCMFEVDGEIRMKNILYGFIEGQRHAKRC